MAPGRGPVLPWEAMRSVIGIVGSGMVGRDPFDPRCWSRSGYNLFQTFLRAGRLHRAFGVEVGQPARALRLAMNFHPNVDRWRLRFNLDPAYYEGLTREIRARLEPGDFDGTHALLQIGGHYNSARAATGRIPAYSYHDGNIAGMMRSPYFPRGCLDRARRAFDYERSVYAELTKIFVLADYWRRSFVEDFGVDPARVVNVAYGVNVDVPPEEKKDYGAKHVVFIGVDFPRKGGEHLVRAFAKLLDRHPTATLHVIGPTAPPAALNAGGVRNVEFHGFLSRENPAQKARLLDVLRKGTLLVLPSLYEPFGNAVLEGMLYQMPAVVTDDWSFPDFVTEETGLRVRNPADEDELAEKLDVFLSDPARAESAGNAGRRLVLARYTWDQVVARMTKEIG
jgi:starch synthase